MGTRGLMSVVALVIVGVLCVAAQQVQAATITSTTTGGDWALGTTWVGGVAPGAGDTAIVNGSVTLSSSTPALAGVTVNSGKTLTFSGWTTILNAGTVTVAGTVTHNAQSDTTGTRGVYADWTPDNRVYIKATNLTIGATGKINANAKGYAGGVTGSTDGRGPGGATNNCGAGYGGKGGQYYSATAAQVGQTYGSLTNPLDPGSGGARGDHDGLTGGGAVLIEATGVLTLDGVISANSENKPSYMYAGGGSGGGGGRIALYYQFWTAGAGVVFSAAQGTGSISQGDPGTIYFEQLPPPVPEPATVALVVLGVAGLIIRKRS